MKKKIKIILVAALLPMLAFADTQWSGRVVGVSDGDTLTVLTDAKKSVKVRLAEIDAPEKHQAFGEQAKQSLSELCYNKAVVIADKGTDRYNRTLARVSCDGIDANAEQVKRGFAWAYTQYLTDPAIAELEKSAKVARLGLWMDQNPVPPWNFRRNKKDDASVAPSADGRQYFTGKRGGCYYLDGDKKRYVEHSFCGR
jgi:endonuclease YncB( thermonuclease family)